MDSKDVATYAASEGFGTLGEDLFFSFLPESPDEAVCVYDTGGWAPDPELTRKDPTFQFLVRASSYESAMTKAQSILSFFHGKKLFSIGTTYVHQAVTMQSNPFPLGRDENERDRLVVNLTFTIH